VIKLNHGDLNMTLIPLDELLKRLKEDGYSENQLTEAGLSLLFIAADLLATVTDNTRYMNMNLHVISGRLLRIEKILKPRKKKGV